jgi:hypothetical protein
MIRQFVVSSFIAAMIVLGAPSLARADHGHWGWGDDDHGKGGNHDRDDGNRGRGDAPEPVTVIGLALGVGGIAAARWAVGRRAARKRG